MRSPKSRPEVKIIIQQICRSRGIDELLHMQARVSDNGLEAIPSVGNQLLEGFVRTGSMCHAMKVFHGLVSQDTDAWSPLITGYVNRGESHIAIFLYRKMQDSTSVSPRVHALIALLRACSSQNDLKTGHALYAEISNRDLLLNNVYIGSCLVDMFAKCGSISKAEEVFYKLRVKNVVTWNALLSGYVEHGYGEAAIECFEKMQLQDFPLTTVTYVCGLNACSITEDLVMGYVIHAQIVADDLLQDNVFLGSSLIDMYVNCGLLASAQDVFDELHVRDIVSWNSLISGYAEHRCADEALKYFYMICSSNLSPTPATFIGALKACSSIDAIMKGQQIHSDIVKYGLEKELHVGTIIVDMYSKFGLMGDAQSAFNGLKGQDAISWTALISGYAELGHGDEALSCYKKMQDEGIYPDSAVLVCSLIACSSISVPLRGYEIHNQILMRGLENDLLVGSGLIEMYAVCALLASACKVFEQLPNKNLVLWNAIIAGYAQVGEIEGVFHVFEKMLNEGFKPDLVTFLNVLDACHHAGLIEKAYSYYEVIRNFISIETIPSIGNYLILGFVEAGCMDHAFKVFHGLASQDSNTWSSLITGYVKRDESQIAITLYEKLQTSTLLSPKVHVLIALLRDCSPQGNFDSQKDFYDCILNKNNNTDIDNGLVASYASVSKDTWNALFTGYVECGYCEEALHCFERMQQQNFSPSVVTYASILKACSTVQDVFKGYEIHADIVTDGLLEDHVFLRSSLIDMYANCGLLTSAQDVFDELMVQDVVSCNALISGYVEHGCAHEALQYFDKIWCINLSPTPVTFVCAFQACSSTGAIAKGQKLHSYAVKYGMERELHVESILVDMYSKCGYNEEAKCVFNDLKGQDIVSWTALVSRYVDPGVDQPLSLYEKIHDAAICPDVVALVRSLVACNNTEGSLKGYRIHSEVFKRGLEKDPMIGNALIEMYAECGLLVSSREVFERLPNRDLVSWNAIIGGYAQLGESETVLHIFQRMLDEGFRPDLITFVSILNACSHAGLVNKACFCFEMIENWLTSPCKEHYSCMVDLLGRAGDIERALTILKKMPFQPGISLWHAVLGACRKWGNVENGTLAFEQALQLDENNPSSYVSMSNIYAGDVIRSG